MNKGKELCLINREIQQVKNFITFYRWGEQNQIVIQELSIFHQSQTGIICCLECQLKSSIYENKVSQKISFIYLFCLFLYYKFI